MSEEGRDRFEIPKDMRSMAEASVDQARKAFDKFLASAQQTAGSLEERGATVRAGAKDISTKAISYAEKNVQASLDYAEKLLHAKAQKDRNGGGVLAQTRRRLRAVCPGRMMLEFRARNRTPSGSGMRHCTLNCIALHKIDMIGVLSVRCPENGHSHALSLRKSKLPA